MVYQLSIVKRVHNVNQGWGTYLLSRAAGIVHYRWWAEKSIVFILKFYLYLTMRKYDCS